MTTAGQTTPLQQQLSLAWRGSPDWRRRLVAGLTLASVLLGSQTLAASTSQSRDVQLLLPSEGLLAGLGDGLRRGYQQAMLETQRCGFAPPSLQLGWLPPGADPITALRSAPRSALLVAPPAAPLAAYGQLAEEQQLTVLLPLQRGHSLEGLPQLRGADRLWPLVPGRNQEADRLAQALLQDGVTRVMVVRDRSAESRSLSQRFEAGFANGNGQLIGPTSAPQVLSGTDSKSFAQLVDDVDWYRPPALVVITQPGSSLAKAVETATWPSTTRLAWTFPVTRPLAQRQIGIESLSRGPGWTGFAQRFRQQWGYEPGLVESAGYDTGQMAALASVAVQGQPGWGLEWFSSRAKALPLCAALQRRRQGAAVRPHGATSQLDLAPALPPSANLQVSHG